MSRETLDAEMSAGGLKPANADDVLPEQYFVIDAAEWSTIPRRVPVP